MATSRGLAKVSVLIAMVAVAFAPSAITPPGNERASNQKMSEALRTTNQRVVASLADSHAAGAIKDHEYAWNLNQRALVPAKEMLTKLQSVPHNDSNQKWLAREIADWEFRCLGLEVVIDIYSAKAELQAASKQIKDKVLGEVESENATLGHFWNDRFPLLKANRERLNQFLAEASRTSDDDVIIAAQDLLKGLDADLQVLVENAAYLEIRHTEAWLAQLKERVVARDIRNPAGEAPPGLALELDSRLVRLESIRANMERPPNRLQALEKHLERIQEALPRTAALNDIRHDMRRDGHQ